MKRILSLLLLIGLLSFQTPEKESPIPDEKNPIYNEFNEPVDFAAINAEHIKSATASIQEKVKADIEKIVSIPDEERTYENTLLALDDLSARLGAKVQIQHGAKGKGKLSIQYNSLDELEGILGHIK